jgi:hypothetical protein
MAQRGSDWLAPMLFEASCTHLTVTTWIKKMLLPALQPNSLVIMDNAPFHNKPKYQSSWLQRVIRRRRYHDIRQISIRSNRRSPFSSGNINSQDERSETSYHAILKWNGYRKLIMMVFYSEIQRNLAR